MAYSKAEFKSSGDKASHYFRPFWKGKLSNKCFPIWTLLYVSFKHILISLAGFLGTTNSGIILYITSLPPLEVYQLSGVLSHCTPIFLPVSDRCKKSD
jgi:hypothetical protein